MNILEVFSELVTAKTTVKEFYFFGPEKGEGGESCFDISLFKTGLNHDTEC